VAAVAKAKAEARRHKRAASQHRVAAQSAMARHEKLHSDLAQLGIKLITNV
jgi:hypothetical protein